MAVIVHAFITVFAHLPFSLPSLSTYHSVILLSLLYYSLLSLHALSFSAFPHATLPLSLHAARSNSAAKRRIYSFKKARKILRLMETLGFSSWEEISQARDKALVLSSKVTRVQLSE